MAKIDKGYVSPYFVNDSEFGQAAYKDCYLLVSDLTLDKLNPLLPLFAKVAGSGVPLLIIAAEVKDEALNALVANNMQDTLKSCAVAVAGPDQKASLDAAATASGTRIVSTVTALETLQLSDLQRVHAVVTRKATHISKEPLDQEKIFQDELQED